MKRAAKKQLYERLVNDQLSWIQQCGGTLDGYIKHYAKYGRYRVEAIRIYAADLLELYRLQGLTK